MLSHTPLPLSVLPPLSPYHNRHLSLASGREFVVVAFVAVLVMLVATATCVKLFIIIINDVFSCPHLHTHTRTHTLTPPTV